MLIVNNVKLVRPEKAKAVEDMIIRNGMAGAIRDKVTEDVLISYLENFQDKTTTITFKRKIDEEHIKVKSDPKAFEALKKKDKQKFYFL